MEENKNKKSIKDRIKIITKFLFRFFLFLVICGYIFIAIFFKFFEIDGLANYRYIYEFNYDKYRNFPNYQKDLYYQGRFCDAYRQGIKNNSLAKLKESLIKDFKDKYNIESESESDSDSDSDYYYDSFNDNIGNSDEKEDVEDVEDDEEDEKQDEKEDEEEDVEEDEKQDEIEREEKYIELKQNYEIDLYKHTANIMYCSYVTKKYSFSSYFRFLNKILPEKYHIRGSYKEVVSDNRIFKKHDSIPDIYNYARKIASYPELNILEQLECAELFKTCETYKDSKKLCVSLMEKTMSELFTFEETNFIQDPFSNYYDDYHYNRWRDIYKSWNLIDFIYYYQTFGGDVSKLKKKFNEFIELIYENAEKKYNEADILRKEFVLQKEGLKKKEVIEKFKLIIEKLSDSSDKFEYLNDLKELKHAYFITNFEVDSIFINESEKWLKKCNDLQEELTEVYDKKIESYSEEDDEEDDDEEAIEN